VVFQHGDVREEEGVADAVERAVAEFSKLDIMFNNAGAGGAIGLEGVSADGWDNTHHLLLRSVFFGIKHAAPHLRANNGGSIISTSSAAGIRPLPATHAYSTFKAGVIKLTESAAQELGPHNIRVNAIAPGWIMTPLLAQSFPGGAATLEQIAVHAQPIRRCGRGEDIARAALFLAGDESSFITGVTLPVDGGWLVQAFQNPRVEAELAKLSSEAPTWME
jgi:NAD(P)-dependent dehydrogenase (short-subunit alcohol dehydrogenase family)